MANGVTIRVEGQDKILKGFKDFSDRKKKNIDQIFKEGADEIRNKALRLVPVDESTLKNSIHVNRIKEGYEVVVQNAYAPFVEFGTKKRFDVDSEFSAYAAQFKGQKGTGGSLDQNILEWVKRKGIKFEKAGGTTKRGKRTVRTRFLTDEQTAFIIARFISFHGIKPHPYLLPSFVNVRKEMIEKIVKELRA